jgi:hypothetical protein
MTTPTRWLLRAFADNWPSGLPTASDSEGPLKLIDRDEARVLDVDTSTNPTTLTRGEHTQNFELQRANTLGVALTSGDQTPAGLGGKEYRAEPVLSVRIQGADEREHGHVPDGDAFYTDLALQAEDVVRTLSNGDLQNNVPYDGFYRAEPDGTTPNTADWKDTYTYQFEISARGFREL